MYRVKGMDLTIRCQKGKTHQFSKECKQMPDNQYGFLFEESQQVEGCVTLEGIPGGCVGKLKLRLTNGHSMENYNLELEQPVTVDIFLEEQPEKITAMYMYNDWWTRPAFLNAFQEIPERTQVLFFKFRDRYECWVPMVDQKYKTYAVSGDGQLRLVMTASMGGMCSLDEIFFAMAQDSSLYGATQKVFDWITEYKGIKKKAERRLPDIFSYLGWCSWDAFYKEITDSQVLGKAKELKEKNVPVRWMILDDGWLCCQNDMLTDFVPDREKFPDGFADMINEIRKDTMIQWFGVWHTLGGYWGGVQPGSLLEIQEREYLWDGPNGKLLPYPSSKGYGFFRDWYEYLHKEKVDFVKVDCQSAVKNHYENGFPLAEAARGLHNALEGGVSVMDNTIINCMGMAMENILSRPNSAVSRNSDDFMPKKENGFAEHLLQNAYNSLYHDEIYYCDWDMFWTNHEDGIKHSLLRAISGGPVYFSDRINETEPEIVKPLTYADGKVLRMNRSAKPSWDCLFTDPMNEGVLKLTNVGSYGQKEMAGGIAVFNLVGKKQSYRFKAGDIHDLKLSETCWVYDYFGKKAFRMKSDDEFVAELEKDGFAWYLILPDHDAGVVLGLTDKFNSFVAVESVSWEKEKIHCILREGGNIGFLTREKPKRVLCNGKDMTGCLETVNEISALPVENSQEKISLVLEL